MGEHIGAWSIGQRTMSLAAQRRWAPASTRALANPKRPVLPPGLLVLGRAQQTCLWIPGELWVGPVDRGLAGRVDDPGDVSRAAEHEFDLPGEKLRRLV